MPAMYILKSQMLIPPLAVAFYPAHINFGNVLISCVTTLMKLLPYLRSSAHCSDVFLTNPFFALLSHASK